MRTVIIGLLALSLAAPAFADPGDNRGRGRDDPPGHARKHDNHHRDRDHDRDDRRHDRDSRWNDRHRDEHRARHDRDRGERLTREQLRHLPGLPRGQEYRRMGNDLVSVDSDTLKIVAVLGLISAFLAMR